MKFNRKHYGMKRRSSGGQAILEYIIILALVAVAALTVLGLFGDRIRELIAGTIRSADYTIKQEHGISVCTAEMSCSELISRTVPILLLGEDEINGENHQRGTN